MFSDDLADLAGALTAAGVSATLDPRDLNLPGVWITLDRLDSPVLCGSADTVASLVLVVPDLGTPAAHAALARLLASVADLVDLDYPIRPTTITLPTGGGPLPALTATLTYP